MKLRSGASLLLGLHAAFIFPLTASAVVPVHPQSGIAQQKLAPWTSSEVEHAYGLPDAKPHRKGTLAVNDDGVTFTEKSSRTSIPRGSIVAVSAGDQRVELWGVKGRLLRMAIPNGGGIAAAGFMHHRIDLLTVEFIDSRGAYHGAVFQLPAKEAEHALQSFAQMPVVHHETVALPCHDEAVKQRTILVTAPSWENVEVPAAYRALVYEHLIDRLQKAEGVTHVYRDGESMGHGECAQYTIHIAIAAFKQGSQVKRAVMGPIGMFVGTTQITFDTTMTDASGRLHTQEQLKATVRGESESTDVADAVAKNIAKHYSSAEKKFEKSDADHASDISHLD